VAPISERKTKRCKGDANPLGNPQKHILSCADRSAPGRIRTCGTSGMKSRFRDQFALGYDTWQLVNEKTGEEVVGGDHTDIDGTYGLTLDAVHAILTKETP
jgi:hypothetical protein